MWMNEYDIADAVRRLDTDETPNLAAGARALDSLMNWANDNSDGWCYWPKPSRAAKSLMEMLSAADRFDPEDVTAADLTKALRPVKAFLTRQKADLTLAA